MCGLVGMIAKKSYGFYTKDMDVLKEMLFADTVRGQDATGIFAVTKTNDVHVVKEAAPAPNFLENKEYKELTKTILQSGMIAVGHNRKATHGSKESESAHPFWSEDENIVLVHNGMIRNHKDFCKTATVDSHAICNALAKQTPEEVFSKVEGAFVFIWYNVKEGKLYIIRNKERPLSILETENSFVLSSELLMGQWVLSRNNQKIEKMHTIEPYNLYSIDLHNKIELRIEKAIQEKKVVTPFTTYPMVGMGNTNSTKDGLNCFYEASDFRDIQDVSHYFSRNDRIVVTPVSYEERGNQVCVEAQLINITHPWITVKMFLATEVFSKLDLTANHIAEISNVLLDETEDSCIIYARYKESAGKAIETESGLIVTERMFFDTSFPMQCDTCDNTVSLKKLKNSYIGFEAGKVSYVICPTCIS